MIFKTSYQFIRERIDQIDPIAYSKTRNYVDGALTYLSPFLSRGVISTKFVLDELFNKGYERHEIEKLVQELAWRDYWQQVWITKGEAINKDLKHKQLDVDNHEIPVALSTNSTGIDIVDQSILNLKESGHMHNHMRMYTASIACNIGKSHWSIPAKWMYYYLLDGDWASNALSWQWVAGANANKKYFANQENINNFFYSAQKDTFLDVAYEDFNHINCPEKLKETHLPILKTELPESAELKIDISKPTLIYNYYNLDPEWRKTDKVNRVLLLEPSVFEKYPVSNKNINFALELQENIPGIQLFVGEFDELIQQEQIENIIYKEHPLNNHYHGIEDSRDWMFDVKGYYPSFFGFWKKCKKEIRQW